MPWWHQIKISRLRSSETQKRSRLWWEAMNPNKPPLADAFNHRATSQQLEWPMRKYGSLDHWVSLQWLLAFPPLLSTFRRSFIQSRTLVHLDQASSLLNTISLLLAQFPSSGTTPSSIRVWSLIHRPQHGSLLTFWQCIILLVLIQTLIHRPDSTSSLNLASETRSSSLLIQIAHWLTGATVSMILVPLKCLLLPLQTSQCFTFVLLLSFLLAMSQMHQDTTSSKIPDIQPSKSVCNSSEVWQVMFNRAQTFSRVMTALAEHFMLSLRSTYLKSTVPMSGQIVQFVRKVAFLLATIVTRTPNVSPRIQTFRTHLRPLTRCTNANATMDTLVTA